MGDIATEANAVYNDFNTEGSPGSNEKQPAKSEIRALFGTIDSKVAALEATAANVDGVVDIGANGAIDDGGLSGGDTDNLAAWVAAKTAAGAAGVVRIRRVLGGSYKFSSAAADLTGVYIDNDPGVILEGKVTINAGDIRVRNPLLVRYNDGAGLYFDRWIYPIPEPDAAATKTYLAPGQFEPVHPFVVASTQMTALRVTHDTGTSFSADAGASVSDAAAAWTLANDGYSRCVTVEPFGPNGMREISWAWGNVLATNAHIGITVRGVKGFIEIFCLGEDSTMTVYVRPDSGADRDDVVPEWPGRATDVNWFPRVATWSVVAINLWEFDLCLNGVSVWRMRTDEIGWIKDIGITTRWAGAAVTISAIGVVGKEGVKHRSGKLLNIYVGGDSITDTTNLADSPLHYSGGWLPYFLAHLDGSCGMRVGTVTSLAAAGETTLQQLNRYNAYRAANPDARFDLVVFMPGTNDIQGGTSYVDVYNQFAAVASDARTRGERVILAVPGHYFTRTESGGSGQASGSHAGGAYIRQSIKQAAGAYTGGGYIVGLADLPEIVGPELADYLTGDQATPAINQDNIHPNDIGFARMGYHLAGVALGVLNPPPGTSAWEMEVPDQLCGPNYDPSATAGVVPKLSLVDGRHGAVDGWFSRVAGSNNGAVLITLPAHLTPERRVEWVGTDGGGNIVYYRIFERGSGQDGQIVIYTSSTATTMTINASWRLN